MSGTRSNPPRPELTTTKVAGGGSAKLVALVAVLVLGGVVYIGISGRAPAPAPAASNPPASSAIAGLPSPEPLSVLPGDAHAAVEQVLPEGFKGSAYTGYAAALTFGDPPEYPAVFDEISSGRYKLTYRVQFPAPAKRATLEIAQFASTVSHDIFDSIGKWTVSLDSFAPGSNEFDLLEFTRAPSPDAANAPDLVMSGFALSVRLASHGTFGLINVDLVATVPAHDRYAVSTQITGGLLRAALKESVAGDFTGTLVIEFQGCRPRPSDRAWPTVAPAGFRHLRVVRQLVGLAQTAAQEQRWPGQPAHRSRAARRDPAQRPAAGK